jgi:hypothetical protein
MRKKVPIIISLLLVTFFATQTSLAQSDDDAYKILVSFSEPMSKDGIFDINNYEVIANGNEQVKIYKVGVVEGNTAVVLYIENNYEWETFKIYVSNLKDLSGNLINDERNFAACR